MDKKFSNAISYVKTVILDASVSENRSTGHTQTEFFGFQDYLIIVLKCPYHRVIRKIHYRLRNNFHKTGLKFIIVNPIAEKIGLYDSEFNPEFWVGCQIDMNHTFGIFHAFGCCYTLNTFIHSEFLNPDTEKSEEMGHSLIYQKLVIEMQNGEYPEYALEDCTEKRWESFCKDAKTIYPDWEIGSFKIKKLS